MEISNEKISYQFAEIKIISLEAKDVIATSGKWDDDNFDAGGWT